MSRAVAWLKRMQKYYQPFVLNENLHEEIMVNKETGMQRATGHFTLEEELVGGAGAAGEAAESDTLYKVPVVSTPSMRPRWEVVVSGGCLVDLC